MVSVLISLRQVTPNWFEIKELDVFTEKLLQIFSRISKCTTFILHCIMYSGYYYLFKICFRLADYADPVRPGFIVDGYDNDQETIFVIISTKKCLGMWHLYHSISGEQSFLCLNIYLLQVFLLFAQHTKEYLKLWIDQIIHRNQNQTR